MTVNHDMLNVMCECLCYNRYSELNTFASIIMTSGCGISAAKCHCFSHQNLWFVTEHQAQISSCIQLRWSEMRLKQLVDHSHVWGHFFSTQFKVIPMDMMFGHESRHFWNILGLWSQATTWACILALFEWSSGSNRARKHAHLFAWDHSHGPHISHDFRDDHRQKISLPNDWLI